MTLARSLRVLVLVVALVVALALVADGRLHQGELQPKGGRGAAPAPATAAPPASGPRTPTIPARAAPSAPAAAAGAAAAGGAAVPESVYQQQFSAYKQRFHRRYKSAATEQRAYNAFKRRSQRAQQLNTQATPGKKTKFNAAVSPLGDKDDAALKKLSGGKPKRNGARLKVWKGPKGMKKVNIITTPAATGAGAGARQKPAAAARPATARARFAQLSSGQAPLPDPHSIVKRDGGASGRKGGASGRKGGDGSQSTDAGANSADLLDQGWTGGGPLNIPGTKMLYDFVSLFPPIVRNQEECQSCWATAATEHLQAVLIVTSMLPTYTPMSGAYTINTIIDAFHSPTGGAKNARLSAQQVIDCARTADDTGCSGGTVIGAFDYMQKQGVVTANAYQYPQDGTQHACGTFQADAQGVGGRLYQVQSSFFVVQPCVADACPANAATENALLQFWQSPPQKNPRTGQPAAVPVIAYVDASNWDSYTGGVYDASTCSSSGTAAAHIVQIVGFGTDLATQQGFWLIRNSWGADWGEQGHIRLPSGVNACGLMNYVVGALAKPDISAADAAKVRDVQGATADLAAQQKAIMDQFQAQMGQAGYGVTVTYQ